MPAIPTSRPQLHINYHLAPPCVFSSGTHPITKDIDVSIFIPIGSLSPVTLYSTLFPFSEMSTTPQDPNTLVFLDDADDSSLPMWPRVVPVGTRLPGGMDAAPGTPGASPAGSAVPDMMSGTTAAPSDGATSTGPAGAAAPADIVSQVVASGARRTTATAPEAIIPVTNAHSMRTRGKDGFRQPVDRLNLHTMAAATSPVPSSVRAALSDPAWRLAMQAEFDAL